MTTPFGLTALSYCIVGYAIGVFQDGVLRSTAGLPVVAATLGAAVGTTFWALAATVVGEEGLIGPELVGVVAAVTVGAAVLVLPALRLARWVEADMDRPLAGARLRS